MNELTVFEKNGALWTDSRAVAEMVEKQHKNLLADIRGYIEAMENSTELKIQPSDFFQNSTYIDNTGRTLPCYLLSKKGCEMVANKLTGQKGVLFTAAYVTRFDEMEKFIKAGKSLPQPDTESTSLRDQAMLINAKNRTAKMLQGLFASAGIKPEYQIMALQDYYGEDGPRLPAIALQGTKVTYDKTAIAKRLGLYSKTGKPHAQAVGAIIGQLEVDDAEREKVPFCNNGHDGFDWQYTQSVIDKVVAWLRERNNPTTIELDKKYHVVYEEVL